MVTSRPARPPLWKRLLRLPLASSADLPPSSAAGRDGEAAPRKAAETGWRGILFPLGVIAAAAMVIWAAIPLLEQDKEDLAAMKLERIVAANGKYGYMLDSGQLLEAASEENTMLDMMYNLDDMVALAQAQTQDPPALEAPAPNWVSDYPKTVKALVDWVRTNRKFAGEGITAYSENGPLGLPTLTWQAPDIEMAWTERDGDPSELRVNPQLLNLVSQSCILLDVEAGQAGAWGPECKIERFIKMPEGQLEQQSPEVSGGGWAITGIPLFVSEWIRFVSFSAMARGGRSMSQCILMYWNGLPRGTKRNPMPTATRVVPCWKVSIRQRFTFPATVRPSPNHNRQPTLPTTVKRLPFPPPLAGEGAPSGAGEGFVPCGAKRR
ncbi:MAG: hypothetical protein LBF50_02865 [Azoarcus sp.]|jgi:hypothetical protein|nr:hypothetical protein [Azoarcus sp.]